MLKESIELTVPTGVISRDETKKCCRVHYVGLSLVSLGPDRFRFSVLTDTVYCITSDDQKHLPQSSEPTLLHEPDNFVNVERVL